MKNIFNDKVYYADTDAYGVVWHGTYLRWMERGRVLLMEDMGVDFNKLAKEDDILMPVTNVNIRYKSSAKLGDNITVTTCITKVSPLSVTFKQIISNSDNGQVYTEAEVIGVAVSNEGKLYRRFPDVIKDLFTEDIICSD